MRSNAAERVAVEIPMTLLIYYVVIQLVLDAGAIAIGLAVEKVAPSLSMPLFLVLYFLALWVAWIIAVRLTEPSTETVARPAE
jgi:hypothetical protein